MHPFAELSAYLDGALGPEARAGIDAHLDTCAVCRTRLAELRSTARLISSLPMPVPTRSLVPRVSVPIWLAPLRTLSTIASGAALFLFIASALVSSLGATSQSAGTVPAAAPAPNAAGPTVDTSRNAGGAGESTSDRTRALQPSATPAPSAVVFGAPSGTSAPAASSDYSKFAGSSPSLVVSQQDSGSAPADQAASAPERQRAGFSPWIWLALALVFGALSLVLGRRLRAP